MNMTEMEAAIKALQESSKANADSASATSEKLKQAEASIADLKAKLEAAEKAASEAKAKSEKTDASAPAQPDPSAVAKAAAEIIAAAGHKPAMEPAKDQNPEDPKKLTIVEQFSAIRDNRERAAFYEKHKSELIGA